MRLKSGLISYGSYDMDHILNVFTNVNHEFGMFLGINAAKGHPNDVISY